MALKTYRDLQVWQVAMDLVEKVYELMQGFPEYEKYGLTSQLRRASVSIPANVAEGYGRTHRGDYLHHLSIARGSLMELETLLTITVRLGFVTRERAKDSWGLLQQIGRMLTRLIGTLDARPARPRPQTLDPKP